MYVLYKPNAICFKTMLENEGWTPTTIKTHLWKFYYVFTVLLDKVERDQGLKYHRFVFKQHDNILKNSRVRSKSTSDRLSTVIMDLFKRWKMIIRTDVYDHNKYSDRPFITETVFKFYDEFIEPGFTEWNDQTVKQGPNHYIPNTEYNPSKKVLVGVYKQLADHLPLVTIDADAARKFTVTALLNKLPLKNKMIGNIMKSNRVVTKRIHDSWLRTVNSISIGDYSPSSDDDKSGRFFSRLTSLPKHLRQFLSINNKYFVEIDVSNSQPLMFAIQLKREYENKPVPNDVTKYIMECETGIFYKQVQSLIDPTFTTDPTEFKISFFAKVFFSNGNRNYKMIQHFSKEYPTVYSHIALFKKQHSNKLLAVSMQKLESDIIINTICKQLYKDGHTEFFTIHDAIYCVPELKDYILTTTTQVFAEMGVAPNVKIK